MEILLVVLLEVAFADEGVFLVSFRRVGLVHLLVLELVFFLVSFFFNGIFSVIPFADEGVFLVSFRRVGLVHLLVLELVFFLMSFFFNGIFSVTQTERIDWLILAILIVFFDSGQLALGLAAALGFGLLRSGRIFLCRSARFFIGTCTSVFLSTRFSH